MSTPSAAAPFTLCCAKDNDLYRVLRDADVPCRRVATPEAAVAAAEQDGAVLILADEYPDQTVDVSEAALEQARDKALRLYIEYPSELPGLTLGAPQPTVWERAVVASGFFGDALPPMTILAIHGCHYLPVENAAPHLAVARVAGYDTAVYGLPEDARPLLFEAPQHNALVATTKLSGFVTGRYGTTAAWGIVWSRILQWLSPDIRLPELTWTPPVRPSHSADESLGKSAERRAFERGAQWFHRSRLLIDESWVEHYATLSSHGAEAAPIAPGDQPSGDGSLGVLEGYSAHIDHNGAQTQRYVIRNDCVGESAMALAFDAAIEGNRQSRTTAEKLADFICFDSLIQQGIRNDPEHPCFGLMSWGTSSYAWERAFYGDDNARALLGLVATSALLGENRWEDSILRALLANLRTTGPLGFRGSRIDIPDLEANGWRVYHDREIVNPAPHYESYLWACYLWAYRATGHQELLVKAKSAIRLTMERYPGGWHWTNGIAQERARMLLCLAWLVRLEDTPEHRAWLKRVATDLLRNQVPFGALREELGEAGRGQYGAVPSNEAYGTTETPLIQENGDPACDLLYTTNFAFLGLHEAVAATGDAELQAAEDRLAEFLCRIQVRSEAHPELDGAWFRAFDYEKWEHWGSSADAGWGAWSIESGWTQGWITAVLGLRLKETSLWDLTEGIDLRDEMPKVQALMAVNDGGPYEPKPSPVEHLAVGADYTLATPPDSRYPGVAGDLADGEVWPANTHGKWVGWLGEDLEATVDLRAITEVREAGGIFMRNSDIGIYLPTELIVSTSLDGEAFAEPVIREIPAHTPGDRRTESQELIAPVSARARYVRIRAVSVGTMPGWHPSAGLAAWLFCGELVVR